MGIFFLWFSLAQADQIYTAQDIWNARCDVACAREGYSGGVFVPPKSCRCSDDYDVERITKKQITLPKKSHSYRSIGPSD